MEIVNGHVHRVLLYVDALNRHGASPSRDDINAFDESPDQKRPRRFPISDLVATTLNMGMTYERGERETFCTYAQRLGWFTGTDAVHLTAIGRALLKSLDTPKILESPADVFELVLDPGNPFAYAQALQALSAVETAMLVDPYFRLEQLMDIAEFDNIERVLIGPGVTKAHRALLAHGVASISAARKLEVRAAAVLHDRYLIPSGDGSVIMLGTSLGGVGKKVSTMTTLGGVASNALRDVHEKIWQESDPVAQSTGDAPDLEGDAELK